MMSTYLALAAQLVIGLFVAYAIRITWDFHKRVAILGMSAGVLNIFVAVLNMKLIF